MDKVRAKKFLGQHFLRDENIAKKIAETLQPYSPKNVLEIGPGMGVLSKYLIEQYPNVHVVELDRDSVSYLDKHFPKLSGKIHSGDFLKMSLEGLFDGEEFAVIGNFPYNISSQILFKAVDNRERIPLFAGMFQREVAQRVTAQPGSKTYGILSVLSQAWYETEYLFTVSEGVFDPPPKVKSGVLRMVRKPEISLSCDEVLFKKLVKAAFNQRRKTLRNALKVLTLAGPFYEQQILGKRAEQLSVEEFIELTQIAQDHVI
ncbi:MAG: 16S rRNA (adenine(1518)-N(6)/adenine(1519)-N(6))-dimethyltransferase RsmA [Bacteroidota bacterium]|nr:16S rRNA (adenine(1518)-N(6)/adenine(1519)-N(6))-dimethyltransferase RsmA [Bacteroidota bacterium]